MTKDEMIEKVAMARYPLTFRGVNKQRKRDALQFTKDLFAAIASVGLKVVEDKGE